MKKTIFVMLALSVGVLSFAQSEKYINGMKPLVNTVDSATAYSTLIATANAFQRIADAEKTQWLPFYYAALCNVSAAYSLANDPANGSQMDAIADKAEGLLNQAEALSKDNSEILCVRKMIYSAKLLVDPMNRYMTYGPRAEEALQKAKKLNPENPRPYLLEGQDKFFTPEQYGGSKTEAKKLFELSQQKYTSFKPESELHPRWGANQITYFLNQ